MTIHPQAGMPADPKNLVDVARLVSAYYTERPDPSVPEQRVFFGTSGHRGSSLGGGFNEAHILAVTQAICEFRKARRIDGPLFLGMDTHALSAPAFTTALEVLAGNGVEVRIDRDGGFTPTPVVSHAILSWNRGRSAGWADGIVITPSHNPPEDGGIKYNPPSGGPAGSDMTRWIEQRANELLSGRLRGVARLLPAAAFTAGTTGFHDYVGSYVSDLESVLDLEGIRGAGLRIGVDPLGGAGIGYWGPIAERYRLSIEVVNEQVDPTFRFMPLDWDGKIRMDCSSPHAMANLIRLRDRFDIAFANDPDTDRHGIVTRGGGLMNPNHYLSVAVSWLFSRRGGWTPEAAVGKTVVSSTMVDRVAAGLGRKLVEVPVGFKWFVEGLLDGSFGFGGEESAGASFLRKDGTVWTTDKDGILLNLLAAEITAAAGKDPAELYRELTGRYGDPCYQRIDAPATAAQKKILAALSPERVEAQDLAGERILSILTEAPGNGEPIGGLKVSAENGWFAARPSGTEDVYKIYAESFRGADHLRRIQDEARALVDRVFSKG